MLDDTIAAPWLETGITASAATLLIGSVITDVSGKPSNLTEYVHSNGNQSGSCESHRI